MTEKKAFAKINLFLDVESRRTDGYHNIKSVMQTVDWFDVIKVSCSSSDGIQITSSDKNVPTDSSNIVFRVAKAFFCRLGSSHGINIEIEKHIPMSAGMAGGSADGAATLEALNEIFGFPFSTDELIDIGKDVGADIPFCIVGGTKIISGIGEMIESCAEMPDCYIVCAKHNFGAVSTPQAYKLLDDKYDGFYERCYNSNSFEAMISALENQSIDGVCGTVYNIFEEVVAAEQSSVNKLKKIMRSNGAEVALMSGSGPSVFGIFKSLEKAEKANAALEACGAKSKVCRPISK